jgi:serine protease Do
MTGVFMKSIGIMALALSATFAQQAPQPPQPPRAHSAGSAAQSVSYMGVGIMNVDSGRAKELKLKEERGAWITQLVPGGPAEKAGLKVNDVILEFDGQRVQSQEQLQRLVRESVAGHPVKVDVWRNGAMQTVTVTIESRREISMDDPFGRGIWSELPPPGVNWPPAVPMPPVTPFPTIVQSPVLGVECEPLGDEQQFAEFFGVKDGLLVKMVSSGSPAARAGVKAGDVIVKVDETRVGTMRELQGALRVASQKSTYQLTVVRNKKEQQIAVQ